MAETASPDKTYAPSEDVVAREIEGEFILVPIASGVGDMEDAIFTLNETGLALWRLLDGRRCLKEISDELRSAYEADSGEIEADTTGIVGELLKRRMVVEVSGA